MPTTNDRFRDVRKACKKTQEEWATILGLSRTGVADIESGRRNVTDKHIKLLCVESIDGKNISETWLRTGEGEMFEPLSRSETIAKFAGELMKDEDDSFRRQLVEALAQLDEKEWEVLAGIARMLTKKD